MEKEGSKAYIISDIHLGAGKTDDCDRELEQLFLEFLDFISTKNCLFLA